jgi:hypothetical protein
MSMSMSAGHGFQARKGEKQNIPQKMHCSLEIDFSKARTYNVVLLALFELIFIALCEDCVVLKGQLCYGNGPYNRPIETCG